MGATLIAFLIAMVVGRMQSTCTITTKMFSEPGRAGRCGGEGREWGGGSGAPTGRGAKNEHRTPVRLGAIVRWRKSDNQDQYRVHLHREVWASGFAGVCIRLIVCPWDKADRPGQLRSVFDIVRCGVIAHCSS